MRGSAPAAVGIVLYDDESLESINQWNPEKGAESVQEYYEKNFVSKEALSKENLENTSIKVCDTDADFSRRSNPKDHQ